METESNPCGLEHVSTDNQNRLTDITKNTQGIVYVYLERLKLWE